jgi:glutathione synthase/RimK-type ligase-like ATP-grasp enzyme
MQTILVTDEPEFWSFLSEKTEIVDAVDYLSNIDYTNGYHYRVINLCNSHEYQSVGYYVSLLAEARGHKIIPSVIAIQDVMNSSLAKTLSDALEAEIDHELHGLKSEEFVLSVYFGKNVAAKYDVLAKKLHQLLPLPMFRVYFKHARHWHIKQIKPVNIESVLPQHLEFMKEAACRYFEKKRFHNHRPKARYYDLAILHNPNESTPPSDKDALKKFMGAGHELGIDVSLIEKSDFKNLAEYDGLFIRETTSIDHHTYSFARKAYAEHMMVIDDPVSILKCCNKVYLAELTRRHNIPSPKTWILNQQNLDKMNKVLSYPCVLKKPDSAFSQGVIKVEDYSALTKAIKPFFNSSDLIIAQEFLPTDYDWRIGIFDNKPIFACKYYMAAGHWQIYNWKEDEKHEDFVGDFDTVHVEDVPKEVIATALKATKLIGDGLYGVDLKQVGQQCYVIEVNDNPNLDSGVEDQALGDEMYASIMKVFLQRMQRLHGHE